MKKIKFMRVMLVTAIVVAMVVGSTSATMKDKDSLAPKPAASIVDSAQSSPSRNWGVDPMRSSAEFIPEPGTLPGLFTCPGTMHLPHLCHENPYRYLVISCEDYQGHPIPGIPWTAFYIYPYLESDVSSTAGVRGFICFPPGNMYYTDNDGRIFFEIHYEGAISGHVDFTVGIDDILIPGNPVLTCVSPDYNGAVCNGAVQLADFIYFSGCYGTTNWREDFNFNGFVDLPDFTTFAAHYGHHLHL